MAKENKTIGRVPVSRHEYTDGATYYKDNIVTRYGSAFQCVLDSTTTPPATIDASGKVVLGEGWIFFADASGVEEAKNAAKRAENKADENSAQFDELNYIVNGQKKLTFTTTSEEHSSRKDQIDVEIPVNTSFKIRLTQGTGVCDGTNVRVYGYNADDVVVLDGALIFGEETELTPVKGSVTKIGIYFYRVTKNGTFNVSLTILSSGLANRKQDLLESGKNIKTINGQTILGGGNIAITDNSGLEPRIVELEDKVGYNDMAIDYLNAQLKSFKVNPWNPGVDGLIHTNQNCILVPLKNSGHIDLVYNGSTTSYYALLSDIPSNLTSGSSVDTFSDGFTKEIQLTSNVQLTYTNNSKYLCLFTSSMDATYARLPLSLSITSFGYGLVSDMEEVKEAVEDNDLSIPSYFDEQIKSAITKVSENAAEAGINGSTFIFITDTHYPSNAKNSPRLIKRLVDNAPIDFTVFGGDAINGGSESEMIENFRQFSCVVNKSSKHFMSAFGNHDDNNNDGGVGFTGDAFYSHFNRFSAWFEIFGGNHYGYYDITPTKTRIIILDSGGNADGAPFAGEEGDWIRNLLDSTPTNYNVVVFVHAVWYNLTTITSQTQAILDYFDVVNADTSKCNIQAIITGHLHEDRNATTKGGIPIIATDCDSYSQTGSGNAHSLGTIGEQAFDIMSVNYSTKTIKCVRIGRGTDRTINY